jgi:hypothetical protein
MAHAVPCIRGEHALGGGAFMSKIVLMDYPFFERRADRAAFRTRLRGPGWLR